MENGLVIHRHHGTGSRVGVCVALSNVVESGLTHVGQFLCAIRGHELFMHFEPRRLSLRCASCGYDSPGWEIGPKPSDAVRPLHAINHTHLHGLCTGPRDDRHVVQVLQQSGTGGAVSARR